MLHIHEVREQTRLQITVRFHKFTSLITNIYKLYCTDCTNVPLYLCFKYHVQFQIFILSNKVLIININIEYLIFKTRL